MDSMNKNNTHCNKKMTCEVCTDIISKYKCPQCFIRYCSLTCYRSHKGEDGCGGQAGYRHNKEREDCSPLIMADNSLVNDDHTEETGDRVSLQKLHQLEYSIPLKEMLENPYLRTIVKDLAKSQNPSKEIEKLMQEPIFLEFADECLEVVESGEESDVQ